MIRVANTGISAVIDPAGRVIDALPLGRAGFLDVPVPVARPDALCRAGDWLALLAAFRGFGGAGLIANGAIPLTNPAPGVTQSLIPRHNGFLT